MSDLNNKQEKQPTKGQWGGRRPNQTGRPKGSTTRPKITDYMTEEEIRELIEAYKKKALESEKIMQHLIENLMGRPRQNVGLDGGEDNKPISILNDAIFTNDSHEEGGEPEQKD